MLAHIVCRARHPDNKTLSYRLMARAIPRTADQTVIMEVLIF